MTTMDPRIKELTDYASAFCYADLPEEAVHECKRKLIDSIGCAFGAYDEKASQIVRAIARRYCGKPPARIFGTLEKTSVEHAAFANGSMIRYQDYNDAYFARSSGHPSDLLGGVLAVAEMQAAPGCDVITATALAYESYCNFSDVLEREQGWDYPMHTVVAAAVASAKLLKLEAAQSAEAVALAITPNMPLEQTRFGEISMWKGCAGANAARNGVFAAIAASEGLTGPDQAIVGPSAMFPQVGAFEWAPFGGRGAPFRVMQTHIKFFPSVIHSQSPVTAALQVRQGVAPGDIRAVTLDTYWVAQRYVNRASPLWKPATRETADHSIAYIVAVALLDGEITAESFSDDKLRDPAVGRILEGMTIRENPAYTRVFPKEWPCTLEIETTGGERKRASVEYFKGHVNNPLTDAEVEDKFRRQVAGRMADLVVEPLLKQLWRLEHVSDIRKVIDLLVAQPVH
jgi:2-methylcitrate dehydratase